LVEVVEPVPVSTPPLVEVEGTAPESEDPAGAPPVVPALPALATVPVPVLALPEVVPVVVGVPLLVATVVPPVVGFPLFEMELVLALVPVVGAGLPAGGIVPLVAVEPEAEPLSATVPDPVVPETVPVSVVVELVPPPVVLVPVVVELVLPPVVLVPVLLETVPPPVLPVGLVAGVTAPPEEIVSVGVGAGTEGGVEGEEVELPVVATGSGVCAEDIGVGVGDGAMVLGPSVEVGAPSGLPMEPLSVPPPRITLWAIPLRDANWFPETA
jgi:hypothetical protein